MTSDNTDGAVDNPYDDAARDPEDVLQDALDDYPRDIDAGDIVIDLVQGRPLYIVSERASTAAGYFDTEDFDLTTYKSHPWLPVSPTDSVYRCVFLPTKPSDIPSSKSDKSYDYPRGRLARVPVEWLYDSSTHRARDIEVRTLGRLLASLDTPQALDVVDAAYDTFDDETVKRAADAVNVDTDDV